jgi:hypothetical protein
VHGVSKGGHKHNLCGPSFETRPAGAPQDEVSCFHQSHDFSSGRAAQAAAAWYGLRWSAIAFWKAGRASQRS